MIMPDQPCKFLVCGKYCSKLDVKCLEKRLFGRADNCNIKERFPAWPAAEDIPDAPECKPPKKPKTGKPDGPANVMR